MVNLKELNAYLKHTQLKNENDVVEAAYQIACQAHIAQYRWDGAAYVIHPIRVANALDSPEEKQVAYLHDVVEDSVLGDFPITLNDLRRFGFSKEVVDGVDAVTKRKNETYLAFILRCKQNILGRRVKQLDVRDNLSDLTDRQKPMRDKYQLALWILEN
ncbi:MAG: GTP pyrophosphokinase [Promethearchaeota archaeon]|jgi:(p)ppGpp synthase/HD superfamily hydrolase